VFSSPFKVRFSCFLYLPRVSCFLCLLCDGAGADTILYFKHVTQFVEATKMNTLHMNEKEIWCLCKNCENYVLWTTAETIHEHLLEKGFVDNY
jgi:hypothetical protein